MATVKDLKQSIAAMPVYKREMGPFSTFFSPERKESFHRMNLEYQLSLNNSKLEDLYALSHEIGEINVLQLREMKELKWEMESINTSLNELCKQTYETNKKLSNTNAILEDMLTTLKSPEATRAFEKSRQATQNLASAKTMSEDRAKFLVEEAAELLDEAIATNSFDYKALFERAWIFQTVDGKVNEAIQLLEKALIRALQKDISFAIFILRNLAQCYRELGHIEKSKDRINEAHDLLKGVDGRLELERFIINYESGDKSIPKSMVEFLESEKKLFESFYIDREIVEYDDLWKPLDSKINTSRQMKLDEYSTLSFSKITHLLITHEYKKRKPFGGWESKTRSYKVILSTPDQNRLSQFIENAKYQECKRLIVKQPYSDLGQFNWRNIGSLARYKYFAPQWLLLNTHIFIDEKHKGARFKDHRYEIGLCIDKAAHRLNEKKREFLLPYETSEQKAGLSTLFCLETVYIDLNS